MPPPRRVVLCADDFGISDAVSTGILALLREGRLSATSVMVNGLGTAGPLAALRALPGIGVGLHLNLTAAAPLGPMPRLAPEGTLPPLPRLIRTALAGRLPGGEIRAEIARQLDAFTQAFGRAPDFVDGHQHVHALPGVRAALLDGLAGRSLSRDFWLRDPADRLSAIRARPVAGKALTVALLAAGFGREAIRRGFTCNKGFSGFTTFHEGAALPDTFEHVFEALGPHPVVMCHPGGIDDDLHRLDPVTQSRPLEAAYLASDRFATFLARRGIVLAPSP